MNTQEPENQNQSPGNQGDSGIPNSSQPLDGVSQTNEPSTFTQNLDTNNGASFGSAAPPVASKLKWIIPIAIVGVLFLGASGWFALSSFSTDSSDKNFSVDTQPSDGYTSDYKETIIPELKLTKMRFLDKHEYEFLFPKKGVLATATNYDGGMIIDAIIGENYDFISYDSGRLFGEEGDKKFNIYKNSVKLNKGEINISFKVSSASNGFEFLLGFDDKFSNYSNTKDIVDRISKKWTEVSDWSKKNDEKRGIVAEDFDRTEKIINDRSICTFSKINIENPRFTANCYIIDIYAPKSDKDTNHQIIYKIHFFTEHGTEIPYSVFQREVSSLTRDVEQSLRKNK